MKKTMAKAVVDWVASRVRRDFVNARVPRWFGQTAHPNEEPVWLASFDSGAAFDQIQAEGKAWLAQGRTELAMEAIRKLMVLDNKRMKAYNLLSAARLSETSHLAVLGHLHRTLAPKNYLEIGVNRGASIVLAQPGTQAIGIDPVMRKDCRRLPGHIQLYTMTSDDFFTRMDLGSILAGNPLEMAFIDGMHLFEFALRDFIRVERYSHPRGKILLHDTYPVDPIAASRHQLTDFWTGDVWKIIPCLQKYRPDLRIHTIAAAPSGLTLVQNLDPASRVLENHLQEIYEEFIYLDFTEFQREMDRTVRLFPADLARISSELLV